MQIVKMADSVNAEKNTFQFNGINIEFKMSPNILIDVVNIIMYTLMYIHFSRNLFE